MVLCVSVKHCGILRITKKRFRMKRDWTTAAKYAKILVDNTQWSRCMMTWIWGVFLYMSMTQEDKPELKDQVDDIMKSIPGLRKRIGGKTLPREKLAINMSERYFQEGSSLVLPAYELFYFMNIMSNTGGLPLHLDPIMMHIQAQIDSFQSKLKGQFLTTLTSFTCALPGNVCLTFWLKVSNRGVLLMH